MSSRNRFIECLLGFVVALVIISFVSAITPQSIKSLSVVDLVINNLMNAILAITISLFAVQYYESRRQRIAFIIDLVKQIDALCDSMKTIATQLYTCDERQVGMNNTLYCSYAQSLAEYTRAIVKQLGVTKNNKRTLAAAHEMNIQAKYHMETLFDIMDEWDDNAVKIAEFIVADELQILLEIQTYVPKIMSYIKY